MNTQLADRVQQWLEHDPDERTRAELTALLKKAQGGDDAAAADLESRFEGPLMFGTAGLRAAVGAGESRMNRAVVIRASAGLASFLVDRVGSEPLVVVGCDARHGSEDFAADAAAVFAAAGCRAVRLPAQLPTPLVAYAVRELGADAGVMVTASHNPPADNGYKVYLGARAVGGDDEMGVQIVPPDDARIAERIAAAPFADEVPRDPESVTTAEDAVLDGYVRRAASLRGRAGEGQDIRIALTPMHGVGLGTALRVLDEAGFPNVSVVAEQAEPDPDFPTVAFPNPEEPGAMDLLMALAAQEDADVAIAMDPDADRCAVAIPTGAGTGDPLRDWRRLSGDEIGALLGEDAASDPDRAGDTLACSIVSGRLLGRIAENHGLSFRQTLTGFKWIARTPKLRFGYEEAIGYCTDPTAVRDKDGVSTAVRVASLVARLKERGTTVQDELDRLARMHGLFATAPLTFRVADLSLITRGMQRLRENPPTELAGSPIAEFVDLAKGSPELLPTEGILMRTEADDRVIVRPSGTEPKLKCYLEVVLPVLDDAVVPREDAAQRLQQISTQLREVVGL
ncbi:phosphomannomutase [Kocuria rhizophila]|uniref:phospho-sugar mutase n=1 Tax=Kocuria rhizophila TaxID=72000 RepID=UPI00064DC41D|nr:phospho-sugar mutase [Kocuria rhizophila]KMK73553.1 phosphomannomutase [Kocuria rhizophila]KUP26590.1 phosphomannomutase [Kocuria rhizophila]MCT1916558.1 phospho-sugar mutase [Kocuria rhizophila]